MKKKYLLISLCLVVLQYAFAYAEEKPPQPESPQKEAIEVIIPKSNYVVIDKKPDVKVEIAASYAKESLNVLLDNGDITAMLELTPGGFVYRPFEVLSAGQHTLSIRLRTVDGAEVQKEYTFSIRHSEAFDTAYTTNELSAVYERALRKDNIPQIPNAKLETNLASNALIKEKEWEFSLKTNLRYTDQNITNSALIKKGFNIANYLLQGKYNRADTRLGFEVGDLTFNETQNTFSNLARRGGRLSAQYSDVALSAFVVKSEQVYGFRGGMGLDTAPEDHIKGAVGEVALFSKRLNIKAIYLTGEGRSSSLGIYSTGERVKGDVLGFVLKSDIIEQKLNAEAEFDTSKFDSDTTDSFDPKKDKAYRLRLGGNADRYNYNAVYEYTGPDYASIGSSGAQKNREGFTVGTGAAFNIHSINLTLSRYNDNVNKDPLYARINTYQGGLNYTFSKIQELPIGLNYQLTLTDSSMEPEGETPQHTSTDTLSGTINYTKDRWNLGFQSSWSRQNNRVSDSSDTTTTTFTLTPVYSGDNITISPNLSFNKSRYPSTGLATDTYTANLDLRGKAFHKKITYELAGTYSRTKASDNSTDSDTLNANFRVAYLLSPRIIGLHNTTVGVRGQYQQTNNRLSGTDTDDLALLLVLSTGIPFSY